MRFLADGISIPDTLLTARDQGRVIFFCGAGVSRARAKLPDFFELASSVIDKLGVDKHSPACKLIREAKAIDRRVGVTGVISADRIFGLLEKDFRSYDIEKAVASSLKPPEKCDRSAHQILLDLATTQEGSVQLVTTNFDRLFEDSGKELQTWCPPKLPNLLCQEDINGVVYLHGRSNKDYTGSESGGFVISSSDFGRAYLVDGWATKFMCDILESYVVVFVGYAADDPPVRYLLESLRKFPGGSKKAYAFQADDVETAVEQWQHKGVEAIPYSAKCGHVALWQSLELWAERARDPDAWFSKVIKEFKKEPAALTRHERGQVAHIVSTYEGAKKFYSEGILPPAEWLYVFDKNWRYFRPDLYGLDSDNFSPQGAWDAFEMNGSEWAEILKENPSIVCAGFSNHSLPLSSRIDMLGKWFSKVCDQRAAIHWASHQPSLHPDIHRDISRTLWRTSKSIPEDIRKRWKLLFEVWSYTKDFDIEFFELRDIIRCNGWSHAVIRRFDETFRPRLLVVPSNCT